MRLRVLAMLATATLAFGLAEPAAAQLPAMRDRPLSAAERGRLQALEGDLVRISAQRNTSVAAVRAIARKLGGRLTTTDPAQLIRLIDARAGELAIAKTRIGELEKELEQLDSMRLARAVAPLLAAANEAIEDGELELAEAKLAEAGDQFGQARLTLQDRVADLSGREAEILAQRAAVRRAGFDHEGAAALWAQAAELMPESRAADRVDYLYRQFDALQSVGLPADRSDYNRRGIDDPKYVPLAEKRNAALDESMRALNRIAVIAGAAEGSPAWALNTRRRAGIHQARHELTADPAELASAIALYRQVIDRTPVEADRHSVGIASLNLAEALEAQNRIEARPEVIAEAIARVTQAAELISPTEEPRSWLIAQRDLGDMMREHGGWSGEATISHYRRALASPGAVEASDIRGELNYWLAIQLYPGTRPGSLEQYREAAEIMTRAVEDAPRGGPAEAFNFFSRNFFASEMHREYARRLHPAGAAEAAEAVRHAEAAAGVFTDPDSASWAIGQSVLAQALAVQARAENSMALYDRSATVMRDVQTRRPRGPDNTSWSSRQKILADTLLALAEHTPPAGRRAALLDARAAYAALAEPPALDEAKEAGEAMAGVDALLAAAPAA